MPDGVTLVRGHVTEPAFVREVLAGRPVAISCLGQRRRGRSPWSELLSPPDLVQRVMGHVVEAFTGEAGAGGRVLWISAGGVGSSRARTTWPVRKLVGLGNIGVADGSLSYEGSEVLLGRVASRSPFPTGTAG